MKQTDCYQLGEVIKTHALNGEVSILLDVDFPEQYENMESIFLLLGGNLVPFFIESIQINSNKALVKLEDVDSLEDASKLVKAQIYLPLSQLPKLPEGQYYYHDLVGTEVFEKSALLGNVKEVIDLGGNQLLSVVKDKTEFLVPLTDEIVREVDLTEKKIEVELPEGLLDINNS